MKKQLLFYLLVLMAISTQAQHYKHSAGVRTGYTSAITYKYFIKDDQAIELMASGRNNGFQVTALYQFNKPMELSFNDRFFAYYGVGASAGYEKYTRRTSDTNVNTPTPVFAYDEHSYLTMGINTILGVEYRWLAMPLTIGLDIKPFFQFIGMRYTETHFWDLGVSVKYVF
jgi:hypothetical protein